MSSRFPSSRSSKSPTEPPRRSSASILTRSTPVVLQFWGIAGAIGLSIDFVEMFTATPMAQLAGLIGLTPGGLGFVEAGWAGGFAWLGRETSDVALFVVAQKIGVISFFGLLSALTWPLRGGNR